MTITRRRLLQAVGIAAAVKAPNSFAQKFRLSPMVDYADCKKVWAEDRLARADGLDKRNTIQAFAKRVDF